MISHSCSHPESDLEPVYAYGVPEPTSYVCRFCGSQLDGPSQRAWRELFSQFNEQL
jgi:hypothetical protein